MIIFKTISIKNFLSIGDNPLVIYLDKSPTTLVSGKNGTGKTSIMTDSICFALFGKAFRDIKKQKLINTVNQRESVVELDFIKGSDSYKIIRGQKPNIFEIYINGNKIHEDASVADTQSYLETQVLKFDYNVFSRVVVMSSMNYTPFLHLIPNDRRKFVESILNLSVFSEMEKLHKQHVAQLKDKSKSLSAELESLEKLLTAKQEFLAYIKQNSKISEYKQQLSELMKSIEQLKSDISEINSDNAIDDITNRLSDYQVQIESYTTEISTNQKIIDKNSFISDDLTKRLKYISEHSNCDKCKQSISDDYKQQMATDTQRQIETLQIESDEIHQNIQSLQSNLSEVKSKFRQDKELLSEIEKKKLTKEVEVKQLMKSSKLLMDKISGVSSDDETSKVNTEIKQIKDNLKSAMEQYETVKIESKIANVASDLLKDGGIKSEIIKQYIPVLVKHTNYYLSKMQLPLQFSMDEMFNEQIITRYADEFEYNSLSAGERARVDIALNLAWIKTAKIKGGINTNLLVLDEIADNALDQTGSLAMFDIISNELGNNGMNIFIISHKTNLEENVRSILTLEKINGFTKIV